MEEVRLEAVGIVFLVVLFIIIMTAVDIQRKSTTTALRKFWTATFFRMNANRQVLLLILKNILSVFSIKIKTAHILLIKFEK